MAKPIGFISKRHLRRITETVHRGKKHRPVGRDGWQLARSRVVDDAGFDFQRSTRRLELLSILRAGKCSGWPITRLPCIPCSVCRNILRGALRGDGPMDRLPVPSALRRCR